MNKFVIFTLVVPLLSSSLALAQIQPWQCGLVDSTTNYTPDPKRFKPGKREEPLGCSVKPGFRKLTYWGIRFIYGLKADHRDIFHEACVEHDLCYRHGFDTYRKTQKDCDDKFLEEMMASCRGHSTDHSQIINCKKFALSLSKKVRRFGKRYYRAKGTKLTGLYCEYDENLRGQFPEMWKLATQEKDLSLQQKALEFFVYDLPELE